MNKLRLKTLILGIGVISSVGLVHMSAKTTPANQQTKNITLLANHVSESAYACVVNGNGNLVLTNANGNITGYVSVGQMLVVKGHSNGKTLVRVEETGVTGYINNANMLNITSGTNQELVKMNRKGHIINVSSDVHVRQNATMDSTVLANISDNTNITITGKQGNWYRVNVNGIKGFIFGEYVSQGATTNGGVVKVNITKVNPNNIKDNNINKIVKVSSSVSSPVAKASNNNPVKATSTSTNKVTGNTTKTTPAVKHEDKTAPAVKHDDKTTPAVKHDDKTAPAVKHDDKTTPAVKHDDKTTPAVKPVVKPVVKPTVNHEDKTTPAVKPVVKPAVKPVVKPVVKHENKTIKVGSQEFNQLLSNDLFAKINQFRKQQGGQALVQNNVLQSMANWKANNCVEHNYCQHLDPQGQYTYQVKQFENVNFNTYEENLCETNIQDFSNDGYVNKAIIEQISNQLFNALINSPAHRNNILNKQVNETAIQTGVMKNGNIVMVQEFGSDVSW